MNSKSKISTRIVVFSKWTRKNYAIFASLNKVVKIARTIIDVCDIALNKLEKSISSFILLSIDILKDEDEESIMNNFELLCPELIVVDPKSPINLFYVNNSKTITKVCLA